MYKMMSKVERCLVTATSVASSKIILCEEERGTGCLPRLTVYTVLPLQKGASMQKHAHAGGLLHVFFSTRWPLGC